MALFEVLFKRRKFLPLHEQLWQALNPHLAITVGANEDPTGHRRECFFYAAVVYAAVYQAALSAGMSTSTAFSLARIQLRKCPFDDVLLDRVDELFSADPESEERQFAERLLATLARIAAGLNQGEVDPAAELRELQNYFSGLGPLEGAAPGSC